ncbi:MAG: hypothetical protein ACUVS3_07340 [Thermodesulfobacteriota bacterium]
MVRARVWFRCAAMGDPVQPMLISPAKVGWRGRFRKVDLVLERSFTGEELLGRMKGWVTVEPKLFCETVRRYGKLKLFDDGGLVVETDDREGFLALCKLTKERFQDQVELEPMEN